MEQRTIKFRAWDKAGKQMIELKGILLLDVLEIDGTVWTKDKVEIMQFTGLKDKNGKEIYEGDIVTRVESKFEIKWNEEYGAFSLYRLDLEDDGYFRHMQFFESETELEVIGNIYEDCKLIGREINSL